jgi:hypothetical protein
VIAQQGTTVQAFNSDVSSSPLLQNWMATCFLHSTLMCLGIGSQGMECVLVTDFTVLPASVLNIEVLLMWTLKGRIMLHFV